MGNGVTFYCPQTKFAKGMFLQVSVCPQGACMVGRGACVAGGRGHAWWRRGHVWQVGGMYGGGMHGRGHAWLGGVHSRMSIHGRWGHVWQGGIVWHTFPPAMHPPGRCVPYMPPGRCYDIRSMSGQYASYWNAFLFWHVVTQIQGNIHEYHSHL